MVISVGVLAGWRFVGVLPTAPVERVTVRAIDDGAAGGPKVLSTQIVPLR